MIAAQQSRLKLPPYGKSVLEMRQQGFAPSGWLTVERTWPKSPRQWCVVVPAKAKPSQFDLTLCRGLAVLIACSNGDTDNGILISLVAAAKPAFYAVVCDGECTAAFMADGEPLVGGGVNG